VCHFLSLLGGTFSARRTGRRLPAGRAGNGHIASLTRRYTQ
jgi:hypothetical protein